MKREHKGKRTKTQPRKRRHNDDEADPMDDFDVPDICLGGGRT